MKKLLIVDDEEKIRRRRECIKCGKRFTTFEAIETIPLVVIKKDMTRLRAQSLENISSDTGITYRINRSIQVEGAFGLLKTDFGFRRFLTVGKKNIQIELFFLALGFNTKKSWMKEQKSRTQTHLIMLNSA